MTKPVLHIDGDSFFASCEVSMNPKLRGKPVVTGQDRGIATAMSKEAKALGVSRGMPIFQVRKNYPEVIVLSSDHLLYETFAQRMFSIVRRYTDVVEEYSIDECFAELDSWDSAVMAEIKHDLQTELGMTFSLGLAPTKVLAKLASSKNKPDGLTILEDKDVENFLSEIDIGKVWGIGPATTGELRKMGIKTALDLRNREERWVRDVLHKHTREIYSELRGIKVYRVSPNLPRQGRRVEEEGAQKSIQATRTFAQLVKSRPVDNSFLLSQLSKNIEAAAVKARSSGLYARKLYYFLKTTEFRYHRSEITLDTPANTPTELMRYIIETFDSVYRPGAEYRTTGVALASLVPHGQIQNDLFGASRKDKWQEVFRVVDQLDRRYGSHSVVLGSSIGAYKRTNQTGFYKRLKIPFLGTTV